MAWLKPYLEAKADDEADQIWNQLKLHGGAGEWDKFANVIREKWLATGHGVVETACLDSGPRCQTMWDILKDIRGDVKENITGVVTSSNFNMTNTIEKPVAEPVEERKVEKESVVDPESTTTEDKLVEPVE